MYSDHAPAAGLTGLVDPHPKAPTAPWVHDPDSPTAVTCDRYAAWRMTKCEPRDYRDPARRIEDIDQATHELVGEAAELASLVGRELVDCLLHDNIRADLLDEAGDVFFCASWAGDAWGSNPLRRARDHGIYGFLDPTDDARLRNQHARVVAGGDDGFGEFAEIHNTILSISHEMLWNAGMLCNMVKKLIWQGRPQRANMAGAHLEAVLDGTARLLAITGQDAGQALARNIEKLDARYPQGYDPAGPGGGIRTGKGV